MYSLFEKDRISLYWFDITTPRQFIDTFSKLLIKYFPNVYRKCSESDIISVLKDELIQQLKDEAKKWIHNYSTNYDQPFVNTRETNVQNFAKDLETFQNPYLAEMVKNTDITLFENVF